ncbi:MAG: CPBP family intramembrane metalloprotease [Candidatus Promineofilum sp.]|nr:CPBP family intramembrane metalloprotease [Promineifilum sp.]
MTPNTAGSAETAPPDLVSPATARNRTLASIILPLALALLVGVLSGSLFAPTPAGSLPNVAPVFAALGMAAWFLGLRFYGLRGLALRGGRPLFAGIGFAVLVWVAALIGRFLPMLPQVSFNEIGQAVVEIPLYVEVIATRSAGAGRAFAYLLLFEAFATQLWAFGLVFRASADWRGGLTAAVASGVLFGATGFLLFRESFMPGWAGLLYFLSWGIVYGMIRLRTGSILGPILIQALQSFTAWFVFQPPDDITQTGIQTVFVAVAVLFAIIIWRLWPRRETDYRV